jgi:hypothetical protein
MTEVRLFRARSKPLKRGKPAESQENQRRGMGRADFAAFTGMAVSLSRRGAA